MRKALCFLTLWGSLLLLVSACGSKTAETENALALVEENVYTFSDQTALSTWRYPNDSKLIYCLEGGTQLLAEDQISGPEGAAVGGVEALADLNEQAQQAITAYYDSQGAMYDLEEYLELAYADYLESGSPSEFRCYYIDQETAPSASNDTVIYFTTTVLLPINQENAESLSYTRAFDKETGDVIDGWDLFSASEGEVKAALLGAYSEDETILQAVYDGFQPEYVQLRADGYQISLPAGIIDGTAGTGIGGAYTEEVLAVLNEWAVPTA